MHRHYVKSEELRQDSLKLDHAGSRHFLNVLRLRPGDEVELFDGKGFAATFSLRAGGILERSGELRETPHNKTRLIMAPCISKGKRMDWTLEKAVELGIDGFYPILSKNSVIKISPDDVDDKLARFERVAIDAARQCGSSFLPVISKPLSFTETLAKLKEEGTVIFAGALTDDAIPMREALSVERLRPAPAAVAWLVGPEGDFTSEEYDALRKADARMVNLGKLILRTETAAIYGLCVLAQEWL